LRFERACGLSTSNFREVIEVGAGYGSMARLLTRFTSQELTLTLIDLPEFSALQRYYLDGVGVRARTLSADEAKPACARPSLLLATWSLSEIPVSQALTLLSRLGSFDAYLFAYQDQFGELDNEALFRQVKETRPEVDWATEPIPHLPISRYLFGINR
jgi:hypothetical protein